jgi:hypothetical protein
MRAGLTIGEAGKVPEEPLVEYSRAAWLRALGVRSATSQHGVARFLAHRRGVVLLA